MNTVYQYLISFGVLSLTTFIFLVIVTIVGYITFEIKDYFVGSKYFSNVTGSFFEKVVTGILIDIFIITIFMVIGILFFLAYQIKLIIFGV